MRRFSILLLLALLISACGPASADDDVPIPGLDVTATPAPQTGGGTAVPDGQITISFAANENDLKSYEPLAERFHKENPNITVALVPIDDLISSDPQGPQDPASQLRQIVSGADTAPSNYVVPEAASTKLLLNLAPLMDADSSFKRDDFYPGVLEHGKFADGMLILPRFAYAQVLNYNKNLFKAANLPEPTPNWTWTDLFGAAQQIATSDPKAYGFADYSSGFTALLAQLDSSKSKLLDTPPADVDLTQPELQTLLESIKKQAADRTIFVQNGKSDTQTDQQTDPRELVIAGRVGIWTGDMLNNGPVKKEDGSAKPQELPFEMGTIPYPPSVAGLQNNSIEGYMISAGTQHPNEAWRWVEFLSRQPLVTDQPGAMPDNVPGRIPARATLADAIKYWDALAPDAKAAYQTALAQPVTQPGRTQDYTLFGPLSQAVNDVTTNGKKPEEALKSAQQALKDQLAQAVQLTPTPKPASGPVVVATPAPQTAPAGATTIVFDATGFQASIFRRLARTFQEQHPEYFVQIKATQEMTSPVTLVDQAGRSDCFTWWGTPQSAQDFSALLDLRPFFDGDASFKREDIPAAVRGQFEQSGGIYGLPYSFNLRTLSYNKTLFDSTSTKAPIGSWKPDDFLAAAKTLTSGSGATKVYGYIPLGGAIGDMTFFVNQFGGTLATGSGKDARPSFDDPVAVKAIQWYIDLAKVHQVTPAFKLPYSPTDQGEDKSYELVQNGRAGMWFDYGTGFEPGIAQDGPQGAQAPEPPKWEKGYAPLPVGAKGLQSGDLYARGFYISAKSAQPQGCWEWMKFLSNDTSNLNGDYPARTSVAQSAAYTASADPRQVAIYKLNAEALGKPSAINPGLNALYAANQFGVDMYWFSKAIDETIDKGADLAAGLKTANELTKAHMDCVAKTGKPATCAKQVDPEYDGYNTQDPDPNNPNGPMSRGG